MRLHISNTQFHGNRNLTARRRATLSFIRASLVCLGLFCVSACYTPSHTSKHSNTIPDGKETPSATASNAGLKPGDSVQLEFPGAPALNRTQKVRRDGHITLNLVGNVPVEGLNEEQLKEMLTLLYKQQLQDNEVHVSIISQATVYVTGAVLNPGTMQLERRISALEAIMASGGFDPQTALVDEVTVIRHTGSQRKSYQLNFKGDLEGRVNKPFFLEPFDIVHVAARQVFNPR